MSGQQQHSMTSDDSVYYGGTTILRSNNDKDSMGTGCESSLATVQSGFVKCIRFLSPDDSSPRRSVWIFRTIVMSAIAGIVATTATVLIRHVVEVIRNRSNNRISNTVEQDDDKVTTTSPCVPLVCSLSYFVDTQNSFPWITVF